MKSEYGPVSDAHVHAYVDSELNNKRKVVVEDYIVATPQRVEQVRSYHKINALLHQVFDVQQPQRTQTVKINQKPVRKKTAKFSGKRQTAVAFGVVIGVISAWTLQNLPSHAFSIQTLSLEKKAIDAHRSLNNESLQGLDVKSTDTKIVGKWLSDQIKHPVEVVRMNVFGLELKGGRLLSHIVDQSGQLVYRNEYGARLTLFLSAQNDSNITQTLKCTQVMSLSVCSWTQAGLSHIVVARKTIFDVESIANYLRGEA